MAERAEKIYQILLDAGISEQEIEEQIKEKDTEFQGFMSKQAILYLIAKDNGVNVKSEENDKIMNHIVEDLIDYNDFAISISQVSEGMQNIVITGKITNIYPIREFTRKDGTPGRVGSFHICDQSECIKIILWDDGVYVMENDLFQVKEIVQVIGGRSKSGRDGKLEVHLNKQGKVILAPKNVKLVGKVESKKIKIPDKEIVEKKSNWTIKDLFDKEGFIKFISGTITIDLFRELTLKNGEKSFLLKLILKDDTGSIKVNIWGIKAVEYVKIVSDGNRVKLTNIVLKENIYLNEKELNFTKSSSLEVL